MMDAAKLARLRAEYIEYRMLLNGNDVLALIDALEKAQEDTDVWKGTANAVECLLINTQSERDSARALLREVRPWVGHMSDDPAVGLRARIEEMVK